MPDYHTVPILTQVLTGNFYCSYSWGEKLVTAALHLKSLSAAGQSHQGLLLLSGTPSVSTRDPEGPAIFIAKEVGRGVLIVEGINPKTSGRGTIFLNCFSISIQI